MTNLTRRGAGSGASSMRGRCSTVGGALRGCHSPPIAHGRGRGHEHGKYRSISGRGPGGLIREPAAAAKIASSIRRLATTQNYKRAMNEVRGNFPVREWEIPEREIESDHHFNELLNYRGRDFDPESQVPETEFPNEEYYQDMDTPNEMNRENPDETHYSDERMDTEQFRRQSASNSPTGGSPRLRSGSSLTPPGSSQCPIGLTNISDDTRPTIEPVGEDSFEPSEIIRLIAPQCIATDFRIGWIGIRQVKPDAFEKWYARFRQLAKWVPEDELKIRHNFREKCGQIIRNDMYSYRVGRSKRGPVYCSPEMLEKARELFQTDPRFLKASDQNKKNCNGLTNGRGHTTHIGGPHPAHWHRKRLEKVLGRRPTTLELYFKLKRKVDGTYIDSNGQDLVNRVTARHNALKEGRPEDDPIPETEDLNVWTEEAGVSQRYKLPRVIGSAATLVPGSRYAYRTSTNPSHPTIVTPELMNILAAYTEKLKAELHNDIRKDVRDDLRSEVASVCREELQAAIHTIVRGEDHRESVPTQPSSNENLDQ